MAINLTTAARQKLIQTLNAMPQTQFEEMIFALKPPLGILSSLIGAQGIRASELLNWVEGPTGKGLEEILILLANYVSLEELGIILPIGNITITKNGNNPTTDKVYDYRILLVEDDMGWCNQLRTFLGEALFEAQISAEIIEKKDFQEVLSSLDNDLPWHLIIADPGLPPWQKQLLGEKIIGRACELQIPAICISGSEIPTEIESILRKNSSLYSRKESFDRDEFKSFVKKTFKPKHEKGVEASLSQGESQLQKRHYKLKKLSGADDRILTNMFASYALDCTNGPAQFYIDLIEGTNWPETLKELFKQGLLSGDARHDAREIISFSERKGVNPEDKRFTMLGDLLQSLLNQPLSPEDIQDVTALIFKYDLYLDEALKITLRENYQISVSADFLQVVAHDSGQAITK